MAPLQLAKGHHRGRRSTSNFQVEGIPLKEVLSVQNCTEA